MTTSKKNKNEDEVITKKFLLEAFDGLAKKYDWENMAKKSDLDRFATKSDLVHLEVKIDSIDLKVEHVKNELHDFKTEMNAFRIETHENFVYMGSLWERHEKRIKKLELAR